MLMVQCCNPNLAPANHRQENPEWYARRRFVTHKVRGMQAPWESVLGLHATMAHQETSKTGLNGKVQVSRTCQNVSPLRFKALMDLDLAVHASPGSHWGVRNATRNMNPKESYQCCCGREQHRQDSFKHLGNHCIV